MWRLQGTEAAERAMKGIEEGIVREIEYIREPTTERGFVVTQICTDAYKINKRTKKHMPTNSQPNKCLLPVGNWPARW